MTIIVGLITNEGIYVGFDSMASNQIDCNIFAYEKVIERQGVLIGVSASSCKAINLIRHSLIMPKRGINQGVDEYIYVDLLSGIKECLVNANYAEIINNHVSADINLLIAYKGRLFCMTEDLGIVEYKSSYICVGSGRPYAEASLYTSAKTDLPPKTRVELAIECSNEFMLNTNDDITIKFQEHKKTLEPIENKDFSKKVLYDSSKSKKQQRKKFNEWTRGNTKHLGIPDEY